MPRPPTLEIVGLHPQLATVEFGDEVSTGDKAAHDLGKQRMFSTMSTKMRALGTKLTGALGAPGTLLRAFCSCKEHWVSNVEYSKSQARVRFD